METMIGFPLTYTQRQLWFLAQLEPGNISYNIPWAIRMTGDLYVGALEQSLNEIIRRHESLRTTFVAVQGEPRQIVAESLEITLPVTSIFHLEAAEREQEAHRVALEEARQPFSLETGPLVRARVIRLEPQRYILLLTLHHIIFDGWSRNIFARELATFYKAFRDRKRVSIPGPVLQYADYALWQEDYLTARFLENDLIYWRRQLSGAPATLDLPTDRPRTTQTYHGAAKPVSFSSELSERLTAFSRKHGASLFMTLCAGFVALLSRYTDQRDIVVGTPTANRNRPETEGIIGYFANTLVLRTDLNGDPGFLEILRRVRETALDAYSHQEVPFEKLVEELNPSRSLSHNPLFQVMFSLQNTSRQAFELTDLELQPLEAMIVTTKFDLSVFLHEGPQGIRGRIEYSTDLFDDATVDRTVSHYITLLEAAVENPALELSQLPLQSQSELERTLFEWNATAVDYPAHATVPDLFVSATRCAPRAIAVISGRQQITYSELDQRTNRLARYLRKQGVRPGSLVGVFLPRSIDMVVALLGILKAGGAYVPLDPTYPKDRIAFILQDTQVAIILTQLSISEILPVHGALRIYLDADWMEIADEPDSEMAPVAHPEDLAYVIFTSGSTGTPKGVQITHRNLVNFLTSMQREPGFTNSDIMLAVTTLSFDIAGLELYLPLISGGKVIIASREESLHVDQLTLLLDRSQATVMQATPATWRMLLESGWNGNRRMKALCGGESLDGELASELTSRVRELWNMYGPTETTIWSAVYKVESRITGRVPIGRPIANTQLYILDRNMQTVPAGVAGELYIGGAGVARGYWKRDELTAQKFVRDPFRDRGRIYRTGDRARFLPNGVVQFLGRTDDQVKLRGHRIEPGEIEAVLSRHPAVAGCAVALRDLDGDPILVGYVVFRNHEAVANAELRNHLKKSLPDYMIPASFVTLDCLPLNSSGKIDRKALPIPYFGDTCVSDRTGPRDEFETVLLDIWKKLLRITNCSMSDNFFELGGHSLQLVRMAAMIEKEFTEIIPISFLFESATIEKIAAFLRDRSTDKSGFFLPFNESGAGPAFFCVHSLVGDAINCRHLARRLSAAQRFYGIQIPPSLRNREFASSVEAIARRYVAELQAFEPVGPYILGGWSAGVPIALEMAQQLQAQGREVALLVSIDASPANTGGGSRRMSFRYFGKVLRNLPRWVADDLTLKFSWSRLFRRIVRKSARLIKGFAVAGYTPEEIAQRRASAFVSAGDYSQSTKAFMEVLILTLRKYSPRPYKGSVLLYKARTEPLLVAREIELKWRRIAENLEVVPVKGTHLTVLDERNVAFLAENLDNRLRECRERALSGIANPEAEVGAPRVVAGSGLHKAIESMAPGAILAKETKC